MFAGFAQAQSIRVAPSSQSLTLESYETDFFQHVAGLIEKSQSPIRTITVTKQPDGLASDPNSIRVILKPNHIEIEVQYHQSKLYDEATVNPDSYSHEAEYQVLSQALSYSQWVRLIREEFGVEMDETPTKGFKLFSPQQIQVVYQSLRDLSVTMAESSGTITQAMKLAKISYTNLPAEKQDIVAKYLYGYDSNTASLVQSEIRFYPTEILDRDITLFEKTLLHEMGHAIWLNATSAEKKKEYLRISWNTLPQASGVKYVLKPGSPEMLTNYAAEVGCKHLSVIVDDNQASVCSIPHEDFPEHFLLFVENPEQLLKKARTKFNFFQASLFQGVRFKDEGYANMTFSLKNGVRYDRAPGFISLNSKGVGPEKKQKAFYLSENDFILSQLDPLHINRIKEMTIAWTGVKTRHSVSQDFTFISDYFAEPTQTNNHLFDPKEFEKRYFYTQQEDYLSYNTIQSLRLQDRKMDLTLRHDLKKFTNDEYKITRVEITDKFENQRTFDENAIDQLSGTRPNWVVPGLSTLDEINRTELKFPTYIHLSSEIKVGQFKKITKGDVEFINLEKENLLYSDFVFPDAKQNKQLFRVVIHRPHTQHLYEVTMKLESEASCKGTEFLEFWPTGTRSFKSSPGSDKIEFDIYVDPRLFRCSIFNLRSIEYKYDVGNPDPSKFIMLDQEKVLATYDGSEIQLIREPDLSVYNFKPIDINIDKLKFWFDEDQSKKNYYSPKVKIEIRNWENKNSFHIGVKIREIDGTGTMYDIGKTIEPSKIKGLEPGQPIIIELDNTDYKNGESVFAPFQQGTYIIEEIKVFDHQLDDGDNGWFNTSFPSNYEQHIDLKKRKIENKIVF